MSTDNTKKQLISGQGLKNLISEYLPADVVRKGILKTILPNLYGEKSDIIEKLNAQLKENDPYSQVKKKRYTHREALIIAVDKVGGKTFKEVKDALNSIEKREKELDKKVSEIEKNKGWSFSFRPRSLSQLKELKGELESLNKRYNEKVTEYNFHIEKLNTPQMQSEIKREAENILVSNTKELIRTTTLEKALRSVNHDINHLTNIELQLKRLGVTPIEVKKEALKINNKPLNVPLPANNQELKKLLVIPGKERKLTLK